MIHSLIAMMRSQCQLDLLHPEDLPTFIYSRVSYGKLKWWVEKVWSWPRFNAGRSDDAKPWALPRYSETLHQLHPEDNCPF
jgi:hypothetical protein